MKMVNRFGGKSNILCPKQLLILNLIMPLYKPLIHILALFLIVSCKEGSNSKQGTNTTAPLKEGDRPKVEIMDLQTGVFYKEIISNGRLYAIRKADLKFRVTEMIEKINVKNGDMVEKDAILATLDNFSYLNKLQHARYAFEKTKLDMQDALLGQGYQTMDSTKVPQAIWKVSRIRSGYDNALFDLQSAEYDYQNTILRAPFRGIVCNLTAKEHNLPTNDAFCTLVDNTSFDAVFQLLEPELGNVVVNQPVAVIPFALDSTAQPGVITEINPLVDENGLVTVRARIDNPRNMLYEGMNVRVIVRKVFPGKLVVPKSAVVLRLGKEVVFTLEKNLAKWNYVKTGDENTSSYTIAEGLKTGMKVIISGNLNLGHDAEVIVIKNEKIKN
jgi:RND family efflux transporter MFP subunit